MRAESAGRGEGEGGGPEDTARCVARGCANATTECVESLYAAYRVNTWPGIARVCAYARLRKRNEKGGEPRARRNVRTAGRASRSAVGVPLGHRVAGSIDRRDREEISRSNRTANGENYREWHYRE